MLVVIMPRTANRKKENKKFHSFFNVRRSFRAQRKESHGILGWTLREIPLQLQERLKNLFAFTC
jgi:hypothetical protein